MKLFHTLFIGGLAAFAFGCSSTTTTPTTDGGGVVADTGGGGVDTGGTPVDSGGGTADTGSACEKCLTMNCAAESVACEADAKCKERLACMDKCADTACRNKCISDIATTAGDNVIECIQNKCKAECPI